MWTGLRQVGAGKPIAGIGRAIGTFAKKNGYTLVRNLASHGVGLSLHEEPTEIATWPDASERRIMTEGLVFTVEPFLSFGAELAEDGDDPWTLYSHPSAPTVQYEHTVSRDPERTVDRHDPRLIHPPRRAETLRCLPSQNKSPECKKPARCSRRLCFGRKA